MNARESSGIFLSRSKERVNVFATQKPGYTPDGVIRNSLPLVDFFNQKSVKMPATNENKSLAKKRKPGRPKQTINRSSVMMVRLTVAEKALIEGRAKNAGLKPSEWFRRAAKSARVFPRFTVEESGWFRMLSGLANNLNQLTHLAHVTGLFSLALKCQAMLKQIEEMLTKINSHDG